jgi:predicted methyltransferase
MAGSSVMKAGLTGAAIMVLIATGAVASSHKEHHGPATRAAIDAALADPARADQASDDARRKAGEMIAFSGVRPGDAVIDFLPGQGYWSRIFTGVVGPKGHVYALWPAAGAKNAAKPLPVLQALNIPNLTAEVLPTNALATPAPVDLVWTVQNYHDVPNNGVGEAGIDALNREVFKILKPGGTYVVIDHADAAGTGLSGTSTKHRIDPAIVKAEVLKAGFKFVGESKALANPADDHSLKIFDPAIRGKTDQFAYKFRKPG